MFFIIKFRNLFNIFKIIFKKPYFPLTDGHSSYLKKNDLSLIKKLVSISNSDDNSISKKFENLFAKKIGNGSYVSFGAGRMALYAILKALKISNDDEVIIQSSNCSVVPNSILRIGASPIYVDIDPSNFGPLTEDVYKKISNKTKAIIVQHSFGIPSKSILALKKIAIEKKIFILEDCALSFGSSINNKKIGTFGDASFFSTDNSKPINTILGGGVYSENQSLIKVLKKIQADSEELSLDVKKNIFRRFLFEFKYLKISNYKFMQLKIYFNNLFFRLFKINNNIFGFYDDSSGEIKNNYPYPCKLPIFLAMLGIYELNNWENKKEIIIKNFDEYLKLFLNTKFTVPKSYFDADLNIIPHRFVVFDKNNTILNHVKNFMNVNLFWFKEPLVACNDPVELGYIPGSCVNTERYNQKIINFPLVFKSRYQKILIFYLNKLIKKIS